MRDLLLYAEWLVVGALPVLTAARYVDSSEYPEPLPALIRFLATRSFGIIVWLSITIVGLRIVNRILESRAANFKQIKNVLDSLHKNYFTEVPEEQLFEHRATLFKACRMPFCRPHALKIYARSGHTYQRSKTRFKIDDENENRNEGLAGRAWFINAALTRCDLPEVPENANPYQNPYVATCRTYAEQGNLTVDKAMALKVKSRSVTATVVRTAAGRKWGVLAVDSRDPQGISQAPEKKALVTHSANLLTHILGSK